MRMKKLRVSALLLSIMLIAAPLTAFADDTGDGGSGMAEASAAWTADDFTYEEVDSEPLYPASDMSNKLQEKILVISGMSESGEAKLEKNSDLVIPEKDPDGKTIQGIGKSAFLNKGLTSVTFPKTAAMAENTTGWDSTEKQRGDYFIGYQAFRNNKLEEVTLPEGTIYLGLYSFAANPDLSKVTFPSTIMQISSGSFYKDSLSEVNFTKETTFPLNIDRMAFASNKIESVWLPNRTEKVTNRAFYGNTGVDGSGVVNVYIEKTDGKYLSTSTSPEQIFVGDAIPADVAPWGVRHFTFDGTTITGLSDDGKAKIQKDQNLILPDQTADGQDVTAIGAGSAYGTGTFSYTDDSGNFTGDGEVPGKARDDR